MSAGVLAVMKVDALAAQEWRFKKAGDAFAFAACKASNEARATVAELIEALRKSEATLAGSLKARGYQPGSTVDGWEPAVAAEVRTLAEVRAALARAGGAS